jgi:hypothetical protein
MQVKTKLKVVKKIGYFNVICFFTVSIKAKMEDGRPPV